MIIIADEMFHLDFIMTNASYTHEWNNLGWIYLQVFPHGKMYAGQTNSITTRFGTYKRGIGSNSHHTRALNVYMWEDIVKIVERCPKFLLNSIEIFLISWYNLTDPQKGYNKTSGGKFAYQHSKETLHLMSISKTGEKNPFFQKKHTLEFIEKKRLHMSGKNNPNFGKKGKQHPSFGYKHTREALEKMSLSKSGGNHPMFGRHHDDQSKQKISIAMSGKNNPMFGKKGELSPMFDVHRMGHEAPFYGRKHTSSSIEKCSNSKMGGNNPKARPVCAFGKVHPAASIASEYLRSINKTTNKGNFIKGWTTTKKYLNDVFWVTKDFYNKFKNNSNITKDMYEKYVVM